MTTVPDSRRSRKPSTIRDVAALAGVSKSTASRAVLGQGVSSENLEKIQRAIEELDFVPNQIARSLSAHSPKTLGLFLRHSASPFYAHLAAAFDREAGTHGYEVMSVASDDRPDEAIFRSLMVLADLRTTGIVVAAPTVDPQTIRQVSSRVPLVLIGQMGQPTNPDVPFVALDPAQGQALINHVANLGHKSIALIAYPPERAPSQWARISQMHEHLKMRGLLNQLVILQPEEDLTRLITRLHGAGATAILCNDDFTALDALASAARLGISVPGDLSIAGHDGIPPFDHSAIGLTTYRLPVEGMVVTAVELLHKLISNDEIDELGVLLHGELITGRTTGPASSR